MASIFHSVCEECDTAFSADVNTVEGIGLVINETGSESASGSGENTSIDWLAQPEVYLYDISSRFQPQTQMVNSLGDKLRGLAV